METRVLEGRAKLLDESRLPYLSAEDRAEVAALLARLEAECADDVQRVILYGSKARGTADPESDIDLLIVTTNGAKRVKKIVDSLELRWAEPQVFSTEDWEYYKHLKLPFYVNLRRDGV